MNSNKNLIPRFESPFFDFARRLFDGDNYLPFFESKGTLALSNILDNGNEYVVELSTPGFKKEDIKIELDNDILTISSSIEDKKEEKDKGYYRREFHKSSFERSFSLPKSADKNKISATMNDGILTVTIPKIKEEKKTENIQIKIK
jgi:HSP20 family protein